MRTPSVRLDPAVVRRVLEEHPDEVALHLTALRGEAATLQAFIPPHANPVMLQRERIENLADHAGQLLDLLVSGESEAARSTTDAGPALFDRTAALDAPTVLNKDRAAIVREVLEELDALKLVLGLEPLDSIAEHLLTVSRSQDPEERRSNLRRIAAIAITAIELADQAEAEARHDPTPIA